MDGVDKRRRRDEKKGSLSREGDNNNSKAEAKPRRKVSDNKVILEDRNDPEVVIDNNDANPRYDILIEGSRATYKIGGVSCRV